MAGGRLSADDLEGSEVISRPVTIDEMIAEGDRSKKAPKRLTADDLEGSQVVSSPKGVDMGPEARRARSGAGMRPQMRDTTAEEAGTMAGPITTTGGLVGNTGMRFGARTEQAPAPADLGPGDEVTIQSRHPGRGSGVLGLFGAPNTLHVGAPTGEMTDPAVQMGTAAALGLGAGAPFRAIPGIGGVLGSALEGGVSNKALGGDFTTGAALGGGLAAIGPAARVIGERNVVKEVTKGRTKAPARLTNEVKFKAGDEGADLLDVMDESPAARKAITTQANTNPGGASKTLTGIIDKAVDGNDAAFAAMQRQHGGVPLQPIAERLAALEERLNLQGRGVAADAVNRVYTDLLKRYGAGAEGLEGAKLSAQQIRNIRNDMGTVMDPARTIKPNTKRQAQSQIYGVLAREIDDIAANTTGVNLAEFKARNRQISTLIPVRDALAARAESEGERSLIQKAKAIPGKAVGRTAREINYRLGDIPAPPVGAVAEGATATSDRPVEELSPVERRRRLGAPIAREP